MRAAEPGDIGRGVWVVEPFTKRPSVRGTGVDVTSTRPRGAALDEALRPSAPLRTLRGVDQGLFGPGSVTWRVHAQPRCSSAACAR